MAPETTDLVLTDEQRQVADAIGQMLARESDSAAVRRVAFEGDGFDRALWRQLAEQGALGLHLPEAHGGLGLGITELVLVAEALGRRLACVPWLETLAVAGTALLIGDDEAAFSRWVPAIAAGEQVLTMDVGLVDGATVGAHRREGGGWRLEGRLPAVPAGMAAERLLLPVPSIDGLLLLAVDLGAEGVRRRRLPTHDATRPLAELVLDGVVVADADCVCRGAAAERVAAYTPQVASVVLAAEQVGVAQQCLDLSVAHLQQRVQFGRPLAGFQALKHRCAQMMVSIELARSAVLGAARDLDAGCDARRLLEHAAMARTVADDAARFCTHEAIQLHGGVGFTWEYDPQLYFKRAQAARCWFGMPPRWRAHHAALLLDEAAA
ncbi:acyl-CoA dehydrogenase family protein [Piscinibacter sp.]|uniref:acyl-CoA dehydrogenase family protein n=1 Tax=Piscinibacter sp. TaxID=1903157 RepID=UPI003784A22F